MKLNEACPAPPPCGFVSGLCVVGPIPQGRLATVMAQVARLDRGLRWRPPRWGWSCRVVSPCHSYRSLAPGPSATEADQAGDSTAKAANWISARAAGIAKAIPVVGGRRALWRNLFVGPQDTPNHETGARIAACFLAAMPWAAE